MPFGGVATKSRELLFEGADIGRWPQSLYVLRTGRRMLMALRTTRHSCLLVGAHASVITRTLSGQGRFSEHQFGVQETSFLAP